MNEHDENLINKTAKPSEVVSSSVPPAVAAEITKDAKADDRTASFIIRRILVAHYAPRIARAAKQPRQRLAA